MNQPLAVGRELAGTKHLPLAIIGRRDRRLPVVSGFNEHRHKTTEQGQDDRERDEASHHRIIINRRRAGRTERAVGLHEAG